MPLKPKCRRLPILPKGISCRTQKMSSEVKGGSSKTPLETVIFPNQGPPPMLMKSDVRSVSLSIGEGGGLIRENTCPGEGCA